MNPIVFFCGILTFVMILIFISFMSNAFGDDHEFWCWDSVSMNGECHNEILKNQRLIIEKLDWNNCAISHKDARGFGHINVWTNEDTARNYEDLVKLCGERP